MTTHRAKIETTEGDFVIRGGGQDIFRAHFTGVEGMKITMGPQFVVATLEEAKQLRDWIFRRMTEEIRP